MAATERITPRQRSILLAIIRAYLETGEPVGSQTLARLAAEGAGMSSATIRNEMAALTAAGLLEQLHTSAGRIPTARAFRLYVDELSGGSRIAPGLLAESSRQEIDSSLAGFDSLEPLLERTSHLLATLTSGVGVAIASASETDLLEHVHFSRLAPGRVLAVVITSGGTVRDRVLALNRDFTLRELETAAAFLNECFRGWTIERIRADISRRVEQERSEYQRLLSSVEELWAGAVPETQPLTVYVGGVGNLLTTGHSGGQPGNDVSRERLRSVLAALEAKQRLVELLNAYIDARQQAVRVVFDLEEHTPEMAGLVLIAAPTRVSGERRGTVGVIATTRIDYERTMNAVSYVAEAFNRMLYPSG